MFQLLFTLIFIIIAIFTIYPLFKNVVEKNKIIQKDKNAKN